jgi:hypothetical protein
MQEGGHERATVSAQSPSLLDDQEASPDPIGAQAWVRPWQGPLVRLVDCETTRAL